MISAVNSFFLQASSSKILIAIFGVFVATYSLVPLLFFQQDEWLNFGLMISYGPDLILHRFASEDINHLVPVNRLVSYGAFQVAGLNHVLYNLLGLTIHFINGLLVYSIVNYYLRSRWNAFIGSTLFLTSSVAAELVMWPVASIIMLALTFSLLAWRVVLGLQNSRNWWLVGILTSLLVALALMTIEYAGGMVIFIPILIILNKKNLSFIKLASFSIPFVVIIGGYFIFRFSNSNHLPSTGESGYNLKAALLPIKYLGQLVLPSFILDNLLRWFAAQIFLVKGLIYFTGISFFVGLTVLTLKQRKKNHNNFVLLLSAAVFVITSSLPFLALVGTEPLSTLAPRYLYFGLAGFSIILSLVSALSKNKFVIFILFLLFGFGVIGNWERQINIYSDSQERMTILNNIKNSYPTIGKRSILYVASDSSYYGLPENTHIMPFQSGFGQTLLVWYSFPNHYPLDLYRDRFLWDIENQGYKEVAEQGFGYFREYPDLVEAVLKNNIDVENVYAFKYNSKAERLDDISIEIRESLKNEQK